jgi:Arc/MetJ-type ribon-helix-helix transcriptional regulator
MAEQLLRMTLPTELLGAIDAHLRREGSTRTRSEFIREAVEQRLLELRFGAEERTTSEDAPHRHAPRAAPDGADDVEDPLLAPRSLADTRLPAPAHATLAAPDLPALPVETGPLFLHGRDYPSLWCLAWLVRWADEAPLDLGDFLQRVTRAAWTFADHLREYDRPGELKVTTMFPTSARNRDSASQTFQAAAVGGVVHRRDGARVVVGPLALWQVARIYPWASRTLVAPTAEGVALLEALEGVSLELPHAADAARAFLDHLRRFAPADHDALHTVGRFVADEPTRTELVEALAGTAIAGSPKLADVYAQAYVSRGREWGLFRPKLVARRYGLTEAGADLLAG